MTNQHRLSFVAALVAGAIFMSCAKDRAEPEIHQDMRDAYRAARELYGYVWSHEMFTDPSTERRISRLLAELSKDFHRAELDAPIEKFEPGFRLTLLTQQRLLADAAERFKEGKKDYAEWRLRGMSANCISCHSRYQAPVNFMGDLPTVNEKTPEGQLSQAEFLFATRQFDKASDLLYQQAKTFGEVETGWSSAYRALKLWLVVEVRAKNRPAESAKLLQEYLAKSPVPAQYKPVLMKWTADLAAAAKAGAEAPDQLENAAKLLRDLSPTATVEQDEMALVPTLRATSILHRLLESSPPPDVRRKGTYLLGLAYYHLPLSLFEPFEEQYLEICIRDFPHTQEAFRSFQLYEKKLNGDLGVSGGGSLAPDQQARLAELRKLAAPQSSEVPHSL